MNANDVLNRALWTVIDAFCPCVIPWNYHASYASSSCAMANANESVFANHFDDHCAPHTRDFDDDEAAETVNDVSETDFWNVDATTKRFAQQANNLVPMRCWRHHDFR